MLQSRKKALKRKQVFPLPMKSPSSSCQLKQSQSEKRQEYLVAQTLLSAAIDSCEDTTTNNFVKASLIKKFDTFF